MQKTLQKLLFAACLTLLFHSAKSQCTNVCIKSGSMTVAGTVTISARGSYTVSSTYSLVSVSGVNTITAGALSVSVANVGDQTALFNGTGLPPGAIINLEIPNATLPGYSYNCLTSSLMVLVNR